MRQNMSPNTADTIAAIATPPGAGGIAVLRVSGPCSLDVLKAIFRPAAGGNFSFRPKYMHYGHAHDAAGREFDDVLAVYMPGPASATGEDVGEIHCHGGIGITAALLEAAVSAGARLAAPGEFTRRAFLNGRIDLTQAEAVAEIINAPTREGARLAKAKLDGLLGREIRELRQALDSLRMQVAAAVDFPDEDLDLISQADFSAITDRGLSLIDSLLASFERARLWREGALAVLAGCVNAGKSSLLNLLVGRSRAIVSPVPGTTRDYIEESVNLDGLPLRLVDTAGLRDTTDHIEEEGIRLSGELAGEADVILLVVDAQKGLGEREKAFLHEHGRAVTAGRVAILMNKIDTFPGGAYNLSGADSSECIGNPDAPGGHDGPGGRPAAILAGCPVFPVSAKTGEGIRQMTKALRQSLLADGSRSAGADPAPGLETAGLELAPNLRQSELLRKAAAELRGLTADINHGMPAEILGVRLEMAMLHLDDVIGKRSNDEILDMVFSSFCIGK